MSHALSHPFHVILISSQLMYAHAYCVHPSSRYLNPGICENGSLHPRDFWIIYRQTA